jgi:hypothetical protein
MAPHKIGSHGTAQLQQFVIKHFTTGRTALVGVGIPHANLTKVRPYCTIPVPVVCFEMKYLFTTTIIKYNIEYLVQNKKFLSAAGWCRKSQGCKILNHKFSRFANNGDHKRGAGGKTRFG